MNKLKSFRLPVQLIKRIEVLAKSKRVCFSAAHRFALERGVASMEKDEAPIAAVAARRVLSKGVD